MPGQSWYYKSSHSARYPSTPVGRQRGFYLTEVPGDGLSYWMQRQKSSDEIRENLQRLSRPTLSSNFRSSLPRPRSHYTSMDGHYVWHKMDLLRDSYKRLYTRAGNIKDSTAL